jgi:myo-inositol-1(or 4)-monophosphatase
LDYDDDLACIAAALVEAAQALSRFTPGEVACRAKRGGDPVTEADTLVDALLRRALPRAGEGWLSEETHDDRYRLGCRPVWVVDPLDGTREFVMGLPEWSVSLALVEDGEPVAGGICNLARGETFLGARGQGGREAGKTGAPTRRARELRGLPGSGTIDPPPMLEVEVAARTCPS